MSALPETDQYLKQYLGTFLEGAPGAFVLLNLDKTVVLFNAAANEVAARLSGEPIQIGKLFNGFFHATEQEFFHAHFTLAAAGQRVSFEHQVRNGSEL